MHNRPITLAITRKKGATVRNDDAVITSYDVVVELAFELCARKEDFGMIQTEGKVTRDAVANVLGAATESKNEAAGTIRSSSMRANGNIEGQQKRSRADKRELGHQCYMNHKLVQMMSNEYYELSDF
jgi:hypothetical protein